MNDAGGEWRHHPGTHEQFAAEYMIEIRELARHSRRADFRRLLERFYQYTQYIRARASVPDPAGAVMKASGGTGVIDLYNNKSDLIRDAAAIAHIAACCHLLHSSTLALEQLRGKQLMSLAGQFLESCKNKPDDYRNKMIGKLHTMDAMRAMNLVRALGLLERANADMYQLGIGAADGTRDILSVHVQPSIRVQNRGGVEVFCLSAEKALAAETLVVDLDPAYREHYVKLGEDESMNVRGYCMKTVDALSIIPQENRRGRNLITGLRIDHRGIPEAGEFFSRLVPCLDDEADFLLTIGAGDTVQDYEGRINKFRELFEYLESSGLRPLLFKLHGSGTPAKQRHSLKIGNLRASSYQILYCKLVRDQLAGCC